MENVVSREPFKHMLQVFEVKSSRFHLHAALC